MRVYHFVNAVYGLDDLKKQRLKIATINDLNDPFELLPAVLSNPKLRKAALAMKNQLAERTGMLCFSREWQNPVQWSHYADRHRGLCIGFDVADDLLTRVEYSETRMDLPSDPNKIAESTMLRLLSMKYLHWQYEAEERAFLSLDEADPESGLYFTNFSDKMALKCVIVGASSEITRSELSAALGLLSEKVGMFKARLAFRNFSIVRQGRDDLW